QVRPLRLLPAGLSDLRAVGPGDGLAPRPHLSDAVGRRWRSGDHSWLGAALRHLPWLHVLHDRLPVRCRLQQAARGHPRPDRAPPSPLPRRPPPPLAAVQPLPEARAASHDPASPELLPALRPPGPDPRIRAAQAPPGAASIPGIAGPADGPGP